MPPSTEAPVAVLRAVRVFTGIAPVAVRSELLLLNAAVVVVESVVVVIWESLAFVAKEVTADESVVLTLTAGMLLEETTVAEFVVIELVFRAALAACEAEMAGVRVFGVTAGVSVLLAEKTATVFRALVEVSKG